MVRHALVGSVLLGLALGACELPPSSQVLFRCGEGGACRADEACWSDGYCHPLSDGAEPPDSGAGGGAVGGGAGGGGGGGAPDASADAGDDAGVDAGDDAGTPDAGDDAGVDAGEDAGTPDAGDEDAGVDAGFDAGPCVPLAACPGFTECGAFDAGCGVALDCGLCTTPEECGTVNANVCGLPKLCTQGFCWENPLPQGNTLLGAFALGPSQVWAVGELGTVLLWNGERSALVDVGTTVDLRAIHGTSATDLYVGGEGGTILHFDGATWQRETTPGIYRINVIWAATPSAVFAGANGGYILKRDGAGSWSEMTFSQSSTFDIVALVGLDTGELYATSFSRVWRLPALTASTWQADTSWTTPARDTLALGSHLGQLYAGGKITGQSYGILLERLPDAGWLQRGPNVPTGFNAIAVTGPSRPFLVTPSGAVVRVEPDGGLTSRALARAGALFAVARLDDTSVFTAGELGLMAVVGDAGVRDLSSGGTVNINGVCGYSDARVYAPGQASTVYERRTSIDGVRWDPVVRTTSNTNEWFACFADGPDRVWVTGNDRQYLYQSGGVFTVGDTGANQDWTGVWGSPTGPWYFIHANSQIYSSATGVSPTYLTNGISGAAGIWGVAANNVLMVGGTNSNMRAFTSTWADVLPPSSTYGRTLRAVHGQRFADGGTLYSVVGTNTTWRRVNGAFVIEPFDAGAGVTANLRATYVTPAGDIWAAGEDGGTAQGRAMLWLYSEDGGWKPWATPTRRALTGLGGFGDTGPFVVGERGVILRRQGADGG